MNFFKNKKKSWQKNYIMIFRHPHQAQFDPWIHFTWKSTQRLDVLVEVAGMTFTCSELHVLIVTFWLQYIPVFIMYCGVCIRLFFLFKLTYLPAGLQKILRTKRCLYFPMSLHSKKYITKTLAGKTYKHKFFNWLSKLSILSKTFP